MIENSTILLAAICFGVAAYFAIKCGVRNALREALDERYLKPRKGALEQLEMLGHSEQDEAAGVVDGR